MTRGDIGWNHVVLEHINIFGPNTRDTTPLHCPLDRGFGLVSLNDRSRAPQENGQMPYLQPFY